MKGLILLLLAFATPAFADLQVGQYLRVQNVSTSYSATKFDDVINVDASGGARTVTLPSAALVKGKVVTIRKSDSSAYTVTVSGLQVLNIINDWVSVVSNGTAWVYKEKGVAPTIQKFTTGSGTYTTPLGIKYLKVKMVGGGGGGGGSATDGSGGTGGTGGNTTFGSALLVANGGSGGHWGSGIGAGGTASLGIATGVALTGADGGGSSNNNGALNITMSGGPGGSSPFGGAGGSSAGSAGSSGKSNTGSGGAGAGAPVAGNSAGGGGSGGFIDAIITNPQTSYAYAVGASGSAGTAGTNGSAGGLGGSGIIIVEEIY